MRYALFFIFLVSTVLSHAFSLRSDAPARYVVQPGDSLWSISGRYLTNPWEWSALWHANPHLKNPNRLYPGAVLVLRHHQKHAYLRVLSNGVIRLSPHMRVVASDDVVPPIPLSDIKPFLNGLLVLDRDTLTPAPYVIAFMTEHMLGGQGDEIYVKNLCPDAKQLPPGVTMSYGIYRPCGDYIDPLTGGFLGHKASLVGYADLVRGGDPATVMVTDIMEGVRLEDKVMPNNHPDFDLYFEPKAPTMPIHGLIIDLPGDFTQGGVGLVAVINRGQDAGLRPGDVLGVYSVPRLVKNATYHYVKSGPCQFSCVALPPERIGEIMVFRTFTHTSIALVVRSIRAISKMDLVTNP